MMQMLNFWAAFFFLQGARGHLLKVWRHGVVNNKKKIHTHTSESQAGVLFTVTVWRGQSADDITSHAVLFYGHKRGEHMKRGATGGMRHVYWSRACQSCTPPTTTPPYPPTPQKNLHHAAQERMIWYVGQYPFWSEQWVRYVLLLGCHSDYWGDTEGLSWSGMRGPAVWDSCIITATHAHTHTRSEKWGTSRSLFCSTDPCNRLLMYVYVKCLLPSATIRLWEHH